MALMCFLTCLAYNGAHYQSANKNAINAVLSNAELDDVGKLSGIQDYLPNIPGMQKDGREKLSAFIDRMKAAITASSSP